MTLPPRHRLVWAIAALAALVNINTVATDDGAVENAVYNFSTLQHAIESGISPLSIVSSELVFPRQIDVLDGTPLTIESEVRAALSGDGTTRLFFLHAKSKLSLRGLDLVRGHSGGGSGGALYVSHGSELLMHSVRVSSNRATFGGAIYLIRSSLSMVTAQ